MDKTLSVPQVDGAADSDLSWYQKLDFSESRTKKSSRDPKYESSADWSSAAEWPRVAPELHYCSTRVDC